MSMDSIPTAEQPASGELEAQLALQLLEAFNRQGALMAWQAKVTAMAPGSCEVSLPYSDRVTQQHGYFHGGVIGTLPDVAGGFAANTLLMPHSECLTAEYKINILAPGIGDTLIARGRVIKNGKSLVVASADVFAVQDGKEKLCAVMQQTLFVISRK